MMMMVVTTNRPDEDAYHSNGRTNERTNEQKIRIRKEYMSLA